MRINFQKQLDALLEELQAAGEKPALLLHSCCGPCSSYVLEYLTARFAVKLLYYNPNIDPAAEYDLRLREQRRLIREMGLDGAVEILPCAYDPAAFYEAARGLEQEPEGSARCAACFRLRLEEAARAARETGCPWFTTTLSVSPRKDAALLNELGREIGEKYGVRWLPSDFKKRGGYLRTIELSREYGLYRQKFCGCVFSRREAEQQGRI